MFPESAKAELESTKLNHNLLQTTNKIRDDAPNSASNVPSTDPNSSQNENDNVNKYFFRFVAYSSKTVQDFDSELKSRQAKWKQSEPYKVCVARLQEMKTRGIQVTKIVALGVGSFHQACM